MRQVHLAVDWENFDDLLGSVKFKAVPGQPFSISELPISKLSQRDIGHLCGVAGCYEIDCDEIEERKVFGEPVVDLTDEVNYHDAMAMLDTAFAQARRECGARRIRLSIGLDLLPGSLECDKCGEGVARGGGLTAQQRLDREHKCPEPDDAILVDDGPDDEELAARESGERRLTSGMRCPLCQVVLPDVRTYERHMMNAHAEPEGSE